MIYFTFDAPESWFRPKLTLEAAMYAASLTAIVMWISAIFELPPDKHALQLTAEPE